MRGQFNPRVESLRGIAALAVVITHNCSTFAVGSMVFWTLSFRDVVASGNAVQLLLSWVFNAGAAVVLFFVLSGYVLALSFDGDLPKFAARRALRLLPAMWASIFTFYLIMAVPPSGHSEFLDWLVAHGHLDLSIGDVLNNMLLIDTKSNPVTWTMYVEVVGSAFVPVFLYGARRLGFLLMMVFVFILALLSVAKFPMQTVSYLVCFAVGISLAVFKEQAAELLPRPLLSLSIGLFMMIVGSRLFPSLQTGSILSNTIGGGLVLNAVIRGAPATQFLDNPVFRYIGRCSYSLYLFHLAVAYCIAVAMARSGVKQINLSTSLIAISVSVLLSVLIAGRLYPIIERPFILRKNRPSNWDAIDTRNPSSSGAA